MERSSRTLLELIKEFDEILKDLLEIQMDKKIKEIQRETKTLEKKESELLRLDKKRDKFVDAGKEALKKKK